MRARARDAVLRAAARVRLDAGARALAARHAPVRVLVLHGTPRRHADAFAAQVRWARARFELLDPRAYLEILDGARPPPARPSVVFTFDDGLASNAEVAAPILEELGTRGLFFVCPGFSSLRGADARDFFTTRIRPAEDPARLAADDYESLTPEALRAMQRRGHVIGNHTRSHQHLGTVAPDAIDAEIRGARDTLAGWLDAPVDCFAWTFAWNAITATTWAAALATHRYCFTACPGPGARAPTCVWRTNVEPDVPAHVYRFFYSGLADPIWWSRRRRLAAMHAEASASAR